MIEEYIKNNKLPDFRIKQFYQAYYKEFADSFDSLTTWPLTLRQEISRIIEIKLIQPIKIQRSQDQSTVKVLFKNRNNKYFESVLMRYKDGRNTVCVSCMIGCPVGCIFCATGKMGFVANLTAHEIVAQILYFCNLLKVEDQAVSNIVFMGMGEPMLNLKNVENAIEIITNPEKIGMSMRRITISTSGYIPQIKQLINNGFRGRLALSLHASDQALRNKLMPNLSVYPIADILKIFENYAQMTNKRVSYEYILIKNINDTPKHARALSGLLQNRLSHVNLIPCNPIPGSGFVRPDKKSVFVFSKILTENGIKNTIRVTFGDDIAAACGQLAVSV